MSLSNGFFSLSNKTNKVADDNSSKNTEGAVSEYLPELTLGMKDEELIALKKSWMKNWDPYEKEIKKKQDENENYWLGKHFDTGKDKGPADNLIFESLETFLPIATRPKADPLVESDNSEIGNKTADKVRKMLSFISDKLSYNLKIKQVARHWALYQLGCMKVGWSEIDNDITCKAIRPQKLILDPSATIEGCIYSGYYIGEYVDDVAADLVARFPQKKDIIEKHSKDKSGTKIQYIQWTTNDYMFWTLENEVLDKIKNPHWNYSEQVNVPADEMTGLPRLDAEGNPITEEKEGVNHFNSPQKPYIFLSIFNLGLHPHDDTNLIQQNIPLQDLINKRLKQIDKNADNANGGLIVSGDAYTEEQAKKAADALRKGGTIWVPTGDVNTAVKRDTGSPLPPFVYESLVDYRNELRNIFGTRGSTPQGTVTEKTVGGKNIIKGQDADRIGGGVSTYLEQFSDRTFNWFVQLMYVYYDEKHTATVLGNEKAREFIELQKNDFAGAGKLLIGVKEGSMVPHDPESERGEALELWTSEAIDPITLFDRLEFPNPREAAKNLYLWKVDPIQLFPDLAAKQQEQAMIAQAQQTEQMQVQKEVEDKKEAERSDKEHANELQRIEFNNLTRV